MPEAVGVDLGGTKMLVGVVDSDRHVLHRATAPSSGLSQDELLETLERELRAAIEARPAVTAIGLGIPCTIDRSRGAAIMAVNLDLADVPIRDLIAERLSCRSCSTTTPTSRCSPSTASAPPGCRARGDADDRHRDRRRADRRR